MLVSYVSQSEGYIAEALKRGFYVAVGAYLVRHVLSVSGKALGLSRAARRTESLDSP